MELLTFPGFGLPSNLLCRYALSFVCPKSFRDSAYSKNPQLASEHIESFKIIIDAYAQIAETLPRFDRLGEAFKANPEFQQVLAVFYADILRFHKEAYIFLRRSGLFTSPGI